MIYSLLIPYADDYVVINLIRYLTFRSGAAVMTALIISFVFGPPIISWLKKVQGEGQPIREDGPKWHIDVKRGTPTMGGCLILLSLSISTFLWSDLTNKYVLLTIGITLGFGLIGLIDVVCPRCGGTYVVSLFGESPKHNLWEIYTVSA